MKPRILLCNECSVLKTGYAIYGHEILKRLYQTGKYELAEHAIYIEHGDPRLRNVPWTVYANLPDKNDPQQVEQYNSRPSNQFGEWRFEEICCDFKPHFLFDIRDYWMNSFEYRSPFRRLYNWCIMPTVDAYPQNEEWLSTYADADGVFTYQDWSKKVLDDQSGGKINTLGSAPPAADNVFQPLNNNEVKKAYGLENFKIIGTIMRNQRRKLFDDLFISFRKFLDKTKCSDVLLYCHTSYPDMGWNIPKLLLKYKLTSKVLFTYICRNCGLSFPSYFSDSLTSCPQCKEIAAGVTNVQRGIDNRKLSEIINLFDLYVQYANSEGFGMPQLEAAACGIPIMSVDYSAMSDVVRKVGGFPIPLKSKIMEIETGCYRAVPDNDFFVKMLIDFFKKSPEQIMNLKFKIRQKYLENYGWDKTAQKWMDYFDNVDIDYYEKQWHSEPQIREIPNDYPKNIPNIDFARWLILEVLQDTRFINSYMESRLVKDLNYGVSTYGISGMYFNEDSTLHKRPQWQEFSKEDAFKHFVELRKRINYWEEFRWKTLQK